MANYVPTTVEFVPEQNDVTVTLVEVVRRLGQQKVKALSLDFSDPANSGYVFLF